VNCDPLRMSRAELERITRKFISRVHSLYMTRAYHDVAAAAAAREELPLRQDGIPDLYRAGPAGGPSGAWNPKTDAGRPCWGPSPCWRWP
jgi:hypothetical protein